MHALSWWLTTPPHPTAPTHYSPLLPWFSWFLRFPRFPWFPGFHRFPRFPRFPWFPWFPSFIHSCFTLVSPLFPLVLAHGYIIEYIYHSQIQRVACIIMMAHPPTYPLLALTSNILLVSQVPQIPQIPQVSLVPLVSLVSLVSLVPLQIIFIEWTIVRIEICYSKT